MPDDQKKKTNERNLASRADQILSKVDSIRKKASKSDIIYDRSQKLENARHKKKLSKRQELHERIKPSKSKPPAPPPKPAKKLPSSRINPHY